MPEYSSEYSKRKMKAVRAMVEEIKIIHVKCYTLHGPEPSSNSTTSRLLGASYSTVSVKGWFKLSGEPSVE